MGIGADILLTLLSLAFILLAAELFTNAVEWLGYKLKLGEGVVGSVLAAVGTAMPETIIPIVAIAQSAMDRRHGLPVSDAEAVSLGAIIGAPFMLGTLAFAIVGIAYFMARKLKTRSEPFEADNDIFRTDIEFFLSSFSLGCGIGLLRHFLPGMPQAVDWAIGLMLVIMYFAYLARLFRKGKVVADAGELHPLYITRFFWGPQFLPKKRFVLGQLFVSLLVMFGGAHLFVDHLSPLALHMGVHPLILALLIVPIATELPEKFNSVLWVRRAKDTLALGNISGAMVFQSTFPITIGLFFLDWDFSPSHPAFVSAVLGILGALLVYLGVRVTGKVQPGLLVAAGGLYLLYLLLIVLHLNGAVQLDVGAAAAAGGH
jgi:cation:H+ antiporter